MPGSHLNLFTASVWSKLWLESLELQWLGQSAKCGSYFLSYLGKLSLGSRSAWFWGVTQH